MAEAYGLPGYGRTDLQFDKEIFASYAVTPRLEGGTIAFGEGVTELPSGQVMARVGSSGKFVAYDPDAAATGDNLPIAILRTHVVAAAGGGDALGELVFAGCLKYDQLVGLDNDAITALGGRADLVRNEFIFGYGAGTPSVLDSE